MKKPNITEGEWEAIKDGEGYLITIKNSDGKYTDIAWTDGAPKEDFRNAKAISAVPDMIKECINSTRLLKMLLEDDAVNLGAMRDEVRMQITANKRALKKAGCTDE